MPALVTQSHNVTRAGAEACPYEWLFEMRIANRQLNGFKLHRSPVRADTAVRTYGELLYMRRKTD